MKHLVKKILTVQSLRDSAAVLQAAIKNLENFARLNEETEVPHVYSLDIEEGKIVSNPTSLFKKSMEITTQFLGGTLSSRLKQQQDEKRVHVQNELLRNIDIIKSHSLLIDKLKKGTEEEKELATKSLEAIKRYNAVLQKAKKKPSSWSAQFVKFLYEWIGLSLDEELKNNPIEIPVPISNYEEISTSQEKKQTDKETKQKFKYYPQQTPVSLSPAALEKISEILSLSVFPAESSRLHPTKQEVDAFRMKAITMLQSLNFPTPIKETLQFLRESPIETQFSSNETDEEEKEGPIISLFQTITAFPGETIELEGSFKRNLRTPALSTPIKDSFHISSRSIQTGFPHPSQRTGAAFGEKLIPNCPHRLDQIPLFQIIYQKKKKTAQALLPGGSLLDKARRLLKLKKRAFDERSCLYLQLQKKLSNAILEASPAEKIENAHQTIDSFYFELAKTPSPFHYLSKVNELLIENFISKPFDKFHEEWLEVNNPHLTMADRETRFQTAFGILNETLSFSLRQLKTTLPEEQTSLYQATVDYLLLMGHVLGPYFQTIILQQISEKIEIPPPMLNDFERKIQICLFKQQIDFFKEFETELDIHETPRNLEIAHQFLKDQLEADIAIFETESIDSLTDKATAIMEELEVYYNSRYYYLNKEKSV